MKRLILLLSLLSIISGSNAQTVKFNNAAPVFGKPLKFIYHPSGGSLDKLSNLTCTAIGLSTRDEQHQVPITLSKVGTGYQGEFVPRDSTHFATLVFRSGDTVDENPNGYFTKFYQNKIPTPMSIFLEGYLWAGYGKNIAKIKIDLPAALTKFQQAFAADPKLKERYLNNYLLALYTSDKVKGEREVMEAIAMYNKRQPSEKNAVQVVYLYNILKNKVAADSVNRLIKATYPKGDIALSAALSGLTLLKDADKREERFNEIVKDFELDLSKKRDLAKVSRAFPSLGVAFLAKKKWDKVAFYIDKIDSKTTRAVLYNSFAWQNEKIKEDLPFLLQFAEKALANIDSAKLDETPSFELRDAYHARINESHANYEDTYAVILDLLGRNAEALAAIKDAVNRNKFTSAEMNGRYVSFLVKNGMADEAVLFGEGFVKSGQVTKALKNDLKTVYKGSIDFELYYAKLEEEAFEEQKRKLASEMISTPAPVFSLFNLKGEKVNLANLKGKVVIVDFWATWCGPCIASFPGMQIAVDNYRSDPNVVFLFVNTWQREENREKIVADWVTANAKYTFNVLLDTRSKSDPEEFEVIEKYKVEGIPTKFIIDGQGKIRFKKVGFDGTAEAVAKELDLMIGLAKSSAKQRVK